MFTPISASGKFVGELSFEIGTNEKNLKKYSELTEFI